MALPFIFVSGTTILASQVNANFAATALTDLSNLSLSKTAGNVIVGTGTGFASNALVAGSGITITPGVGTVTITASGSSSLTVGTSPISSGSNNYILYNNSGVLGNYATSGTGTTVAMATGAALTTPTMQAGGHGNTPQLSPPSYAQGWVWYDSGNDGLAYFNGATGNQVIAGQEVQIRVYNATASTIPIGTPVYITGAFSGIPTVSPCLNTSFAAAQCIGLTTQAIAVSGTGYVMAAGTIRSVNTSAYSAGDTLYVGASAGTLVNTNPGSGYYATVVGYVSVVNASTGKITVMPGVPASISAGGGLAVGSSAISGGTSGRVLYDNAGVLGELATTGSGSVVQATSPTLVTPALGTPSAAVLTNATGLPLTTGVTGLLPVANGGTGTSTPALVAGTNVTISGSWPNQTINASGGGGGSSINVSQAGSTVVSGLTVLNFVQGAAVSAAGTQANVTIPTDYFGSGPPSTGSTPSLDGTATGQWSGAASGTVTISTTQVNDVVVLLIGCEQNAALQTVASVASSHLTWARRGGFNGQPGSGNYQSFEIWWAPAASILTSEVVTITLSAATDDAAVVAFAVHGAANIASPWDTGSLPVITTGNPAAAPVFTTVQAHDFVFAASFSSSNTNDTSAWTSIANANNGGGTNYAYVTSFYEVVSSPQAAATASLTTANPNLKIRLVDAITGDVITTYVNGDRYYDQSTTPYTEYVYAAGTWHQAGLVGYATGAGGTVTQATSRTTGVTINTPSGAITMFSAAGSATAATFAVANSSVAATDTICLSQTSGTNLYNFIPTAVSAGSFNITFYTTGGTATDAPVINFNVIKGTTS